MKITEGKNLFYFLGGALILSLPTTLMVPSNSASSFDFSVFLIYTGALFAALVILFLKSLILKIFLAGLVLFIDLYLIIALGVGASPEFHAGEIPGYYFLIWLLFLASSLLLLVFLIMSVFKRGEM